MADTFETAADLITLNDHNLSDVQGITDLLQDAPVVARLAATTSSNGTKHKYEVEDGAPVVGWRDINTGVEHDVSSDRIAEIDLKFMDPHTRVDVAAAKMMSRSVIGGEMGFVARKNRRALRAGFATFEKQIFAGQASGNPAGFEGFQDSLNALALENVIDGGGASNLSSVYLIRTNDEHMDCSIVLGNDGNIEIGTPFQQEVQDATGKHYIAWVTAIGAYQGLQVGSKWSVVRIANVETLNDDTLADARAVFPSTKQPNLIVMTRNKLTSLRKSRGTYTRNQVGNPQQTPSDHEGIDIITTDQLTDSEAAVV